MKSYTIREKFKNYFSAQDHLWLKSATLIPEKNSSLLFTNAGMNPFKDFFLSLKKAPHPQISSIQKCMRAGGKHNDLEEVGYSPYHHTFFEMMGNFSFGSYFKREAIDYALCFLTKELGIPKERLWLSVFREDQESFEIWTKDQGFPREKIFLLGEKDNFWRMGDTGPSGPCSEIYYYEGSKKEAKPEDMTEIWNLVFMEFNEFFKGAKKTREKLSKASIDTGMGLERLATVLQGKKSNYHTDLFKNIIQALEKASGIKYDFTGEAEEKERRAEEKQVAFRVVADHSRAISFLIGDGVLPASDGASYVLRRILRRALFYSHKLDSKKELLSASVRAVIDTMSPIYPNLEKEKHLILSTIEAENNLFQQSLKEGQNVFLKKISTLSQKKIPDEMLWDLYNTYGFPPDLSSLIAREKGLLVNSLSLEELKNKFSKDSKRKPKKAKALTNEKDSSELLEQWNHLKNYEMDIVRHLKKKNTEFTGYEKSEEEGRVLLLLKMKELSLSDTNTYSSQQKPDFKKWELAFLSKLKAGDMSWLITDKTCFYPEGGGPIGDKGFLKWHYTDEKGEKQEEGKALVLDSQKLGSLNFHAIKVLKGNLKCGKLCKMKVDTEHRKFIAQSHSATHLLNQSLRAVLGNSIRQMGSLVEPGKLRFDFSYPKPLSNKELKKIEHKVKSYIQAGHSVIDNVCSYEQAISQGAISLAGENYTKNTRVIRMGESFELCGGIHVKNTAEIYDFKIISETGVKSGVRRIQALTGEVLKQWFKLVAKQNEELREYLKLSLPRLKTFSKKDQTEEKSTLEMLTLNEKENPFILIAQKKDEEIKRLKNQVKNLSSSFQSEKALENAKTFTCQNIKAHLLMTSFPIEDRKILAEKADQLKAKLSGPALVIALGEKAEGHPIVLTLSKELRQYVSAGDILKNILAPRLDGKGGGSPRFAQGTIKNKSQFLKMEKVLLDILNTK